MVMAPAVIPPVTTTVVGGVVVLHVLHVDIEAGVVLYTARLCSFTFHCFLAAGIVEHLVLVLNLEEQALHRSGP